MSDPSFEQQLSRLFAEPPPLADSGPFAARVQARLDRGWLVRRWAIAAAGVVGGLVTAAQVIDAHLLARAGAASRDADTQVHDVVADLGLRGQALLGAVHLPAVGGEVLWMVAGLGAMAVALVAARVMDAW